MEYPRYVLEALRQRLLDVKKDDTSRDIEIPILPRQDVFTELVEFRLGGGWGDSIFEWLDDCGLKVVEKESQGD